MDTRASGSNGGHGAGHGILRVCVLISRLRQCMQAPSTVTPLLHNKASTRTHTKYIYGPHTSPAHNQPKASRFDFELHICLCCHTAWRQYQAQRVFIPYLLMLLADGLSPLA